MSGIVNGIRSYFGLENVIILVPICAFVIFDSAFNSFSSVLALVQEEFPEASDVSVKLILSMPSLLQIPTMLVSGYLASRFYKRSLGLTALVLIFIGAMLPVVIRGGGIEVLFVSAAIIGISQGIMHPLSSAIVCSTWEKEDRRKALGFKQAANYIGAAVISILIGHLAAIGWRNAYLVYLLVIPSFIITFLRLPKGELDEQIVGVGIGFSGLKKMFKPSIVYLLVLFGFAAMFQFAFHGNIAMAVTQKGIGGPEQVSVVTAVNYVISFVLGIVYGKLSSVLRDRTLSFGFVLMAAGLLVCVLSSSFAQIVVGGAIFGFGSGIQEVSTIYYISRERNENITMLLAIALVFVNIGITLSPIAISAIEHATSLTAGASSSMLIACAGFAVLAVIEWFVRTREHRHDPDFVSFREERRQLKSGEKNE